MKKILLTLFTVGLLIDLSACQQKIAADDTASLQESIEKIKSKIQENLGKDKKQETENPSEPALP